MNNNNNNDLIVKPPIYNKVEAILDTVEELSVYKNIMKNNIDDKITVQLENTEYN